MKNVPRQKLWKQRAIFTMIRPTVEGLWVKMHNSRVTLYTIHGASEASRSEKKMVHRVGWYHSKAHQI